MDIGVGGTLFQPESHFKLSLKRSSFLFPVQLPLSWRLNQIGSFSGLLLLGHSQAISYVRNARWLFRFFLYRDKSIVPLCDLYHPASLSALYCASRRPLLIARLWFVLS